MAYMTQENKAHIAAVLKQQLAEKFPTVRLKWSLSVLHHSTLVLKVKSGNVDFFGALNPETINQDILRAVMTVNAMHLNPYHFQNRFVEGAVQDLLGTIVSSLNHGNWDRSHPETDYFDVGWYIDVYIGTSKAPYQFIA